MMEDIVFEVEHLDSTTGTGADGDNGWTPALAVIPDSERRVLQVTNWFGGTGTKPATGLYVGATGLVADIEDAMDIRGAAGSGGGTGGDADTLEGQNGAYYLSRPNHTGNIPAANVTESSTKRFTTDAEKSDWNSRVTASELSAAIAALIDGAPGAIDTLNELAAALGDDPNFATTITNLISAKEAAANKATDLTSPNNTKYPTTLAVSSVVDALQVDIDAKADAAATTAALGDKANTADLAAVATSGDYAAFLNAMRITEL